jgi:hypothetical protein
LVTFRPFILSESPRDETQDKRDNQERKELHEGARLPYCSAGVLWPCRARNHATGSHRPNQINKRTLVPEAQIRQIL